MALSDHNELTLSGLVWSMDTHGMSLICAIQNDGRWKYG